MGRHLRLLVVGLHRGLDGSFVWRGRRWDVQRHDRIDGDEGGRWLVGDLGLDLCSEERGDMENIWDLGLSHARLYPLNIWVMSHAWKLVGWM